MKRVVVVLAGAAILIGTLPGVASAARVSKFTEHRVSVGCESPIDGGYISTFAESSSAFGNFAGFDVWFDPAIPFEEPSDVTGATDAGDVSEGDTGVDVNVDYAATDQAGNDLGTATLVATLEKVGEPFTDPPFPNGNHHTANVIVHQSLEGTGTFTVLGVAYDLPCFGEIIDAQIHEANPTSFVNSNEGVQIDCFWETEDAIAGLFVIDDAFGFFADAFLSTAELETGGTGQFSGSLDAESLEATMNLVDFVTNDPITATASATFTPIGEPVTSMITQQHVRNKVVEQALAPDGSLGFSTGQTFTIDSENCRARAFSSHLVASSPKGPKAGTAPANDTPDGAIALEPGDKLNERTTGTAPDAEVPITTCPEGELDNLGHTVWFTVEGTGDEITFDTAGSDFDTVLAVYTREGDTFTELACVDDVFFDPIGTSFQASITGPTELGVTYWVQVGGFLNFFDGSSQSGLLHVAVY